MKQTDTPGLEEIIRLCCSSSRAEYQRGWRLFVENYGDALTRYVSYAVQRWRMPRLARQKQETVHDVCAEVFKILQKHLADFRETSNEAMFRSWLSVICNRAAGRYIQREYNKALGEDDAAEYIEFAGGMEDDQRWELFEKVIQTLYENAGPKARNVERDINIFMLYTWADLSAPMVFNHPCYRDEGKRVVDLVVNRMRERLRKSDL